MKSNTILRLIPTVFIFVIFCSCGELSKTEQEKMPYFDLKGFVKMEAEKLDGSEAILTSRVQGVENRETKTLTKKQWLEAFDTFIQADINKPALYLSYDTKVKNNILTHSLFEDADEKVKEIKLTYIDDKVVAATLKSSENNLFYSTSTLAEMYINNHTKKVDHYSIETTQKIWFLAPSNIKIMGTIREK